MSTDRAGEVDDASPDSHVDLRGRQVAAFAEAQEEMLELAAGRLGSFLEAGLKAMDLGLPDRVADTGG